jgi:hypothetical protein
MVGWPLSRDLVGTSPAVVIANPQQHYLHHFVPLKSTYHLSFDPHDFPQTATTTLHQITTSQLGMAPKRKYLPEEDSSSSGDRANGQIGAKRARRQETNSSTISIRGEGQGHSRGSIDQDRFPKPRTKRAKPPKGSTTSRAGNRQAKLAAELANLADYNAPPVTRPGEVESDNDDNVRPSAHELRSLYQLWLHRNRTPDRRSAQPRMLIAGSASSTRLQSSDRGRTGILRRGAQMTRVPMIA